MSALIRNQKRFLNSYGKTMAFKLNYPTHYLRYLTIRYQTQNLISASANSQALLNLRSVPRLNVENYIGHLALSSSIGELHVPQWGLLQRAYSYNVIRNFQLGSYLRDNPSSKVEATVQTMKKVQKEKVEEILKEATIGSAAANADTIATTTTASGTATTSGTETASGTLTATGKGTATLKVNSATATISTEEKMKATAAAQSTKASFTAQASSTDVPSTKAQELKPVVVKKSLKTRIWEELVHYYHGFRLLFIDINICRKLLWQILHGKTLTRRENNLLVRTTSDLFRLIPFSVFIIVPFMELLLPLFIKFFPGMLPSTFQTSKERENKLKQSLQVKLEMAKFLQKTLDEMAVQHKEHKSEEAKQFVNFFHRIKNPNEYVSKDELIKYASRFKDEITLDSLSREQLAALCRLLEINTMGTTNFLRFQLRVKLRSLAADDRVIAREGVQSLDLYELQQACKARGMRAYGLTSERLHAQLQEWIDLSLNEKVPPTLLLLSRAMFISDDHTTTDKLKETIRVLPDSVAAQTKAAIGELEGKIDNKTKIEVIKEEERKIKEERDEEQEEAKAKSVAEELIDKAPTISTDDPIQTVAGSPTIAKESISTDTVEDKTISSKDVELLSEALKTLSSDKKKMMVEKEQLKEIKEELEDYKEDVEELHEVRNFVKEPVHESRAAKLLFKKVNKMLGQLDKVLDDLEKKQQEIQKLSNPEQSPEKATEQYNQQEMVHVHELMQAIKKVQQTSTESRLKQIENVLSKLDTDKDGVVTVDEVLKVIEAIGRENIKLDEKQIEEVITLLDKEQLIMAEEKIEKALAKSIKEAEIIKAKKQRMELRRIAAEQALFEEMKDKAPEFKDLQDLSEKSEKVETKTCKSDPLRKKGSCTPQANIRIPSLDGEDPNTSAQKPQPPSMKPEPSNTTAASTPPAATPTSTSTSNSLPSSTTPPPPPPPPPPSATGGATKINSKDKML